MSMYFSIMMLSCCPKQLIFYIIALSYKVQQALCDKTREKKSEIRAYDMKACHLPVLANHLLRINTHSPNTHAKHT